MRMVWPKPSPARGGGAQSATEGCQRMRNPANLSDTLARRYPTTTQLRCAVPLPLQGRI
jgi:hypothetical protein